MKKIFLALSFLSVSVFSMEVTVSIVPQKYFVEKIAKDKVSVNTMVKPGFSPATYEPKVSQMKKLTNSDIYFSIGVPFENAWLEKFENANKSMHIVDTTKGIKKIAMAEHSHGEEEGHKEDMHGHHDEHDEHDDHKEHGHDKHDEHDDHEEHGHDKHDEHDDHKDHDHSGLDPHVWLDPVLVKTQSKNILDALVKHDPKNAKFYKANYKEFVKELDALDHEIHEILEPYEHKEFMVFHPSWGYFAKRYHLEQLAIEVQGKEPKPNELIELIEDAKKHNIKIVFVAPQFSVKSAKTISKSINGTVTIINPLSVKWDEELLKTAREIANSYK